MLLNECTRTLWTSSSSFRPYLLDGTFGNGQQFMKLWPIHYRPYFYVIRIDSRISFDIQDEDRFFDDIDPVVDAIEAEVGTCCDAMFETGRCTCDGFEVWPSFTENSSAGWAWALMDESELRELIP